MCLQTLLSTSCGTGTDQEGFELETVSVNMWGVLIQILYLYTRSAIMAICDYTGGHHDCCCIAETFRRGTR